MFNPVVLIIFTKFWNYHYHVFPKHFITPNRNCTHSSLPQPLVTSFVLSISVNLLIHPCSSRCQKFIPFDDWTLLYSNIHTYIYMCVCVCITFCLSILFIDTWVVSTFLAIVNSAAVNTDIQVSVLSPHFQFFGIHI